MKRCSGVSLAPAFLTLIAIAACLAACGESGDQAAGTPSAWPYEPWRPEDIFPPDQLATLSDVERNVLPPNLRIATGAPVREIGWDAEEMARGLVAAGPDRFVFWNRSIVVDSELAPPTFEEPASPGDVIADLRPVVAVKPIEHEPGEVVGYYFEFDTVATFDSPNFWRWPTLVPVHDEEDLLVRQGRTFALLRTWQRDAEPGEPKMQFPFRVSAMRLPEDRASIDAAEFDRHARALAWGLEVDQAAEEIFQYVQHTIQHARDARSRNPLEVLVRGMGECGGTNACAAAILERHAIRARRVAGASLAARLVQGRSGHTATEVWLDDGLGWSYFDPYFDFYFPGVSAAVLADDETACSTLITIFPRPLQDEHGPGVTLAQLFGYRQYMDHFQRQAMANMFQLGDGHAEFGLDWPLLEARPAPELTELFPETIRVHVRARYVITNGSVLRYARAYRSDEERAVIRQDEPRLSPWATTHFDVPVRRLLEASSGVKEEQREAGNLPGVSGGFVSSRNAS